VAEGRAQVLKISHILKQSATVEKHRWVGVEGGHGFDLVRAQRQPFQSRVGMELVYLELEVMGSIGSKCNVICAFTVGNFSCLQGCHCPIVGPIQQLAQILCEERVEGSAGIPASVLELPLPHPTPFLRQQGCTLSWYKALTVEIK